MKNFLSTLILLSLAFVILINPSCKKDVPEDLTGPEITIFGDTIITIALGTNWKDFVPEPQAYAYDNWDGEVRVTNTNNVNKNLTGTYTVNYQAKDNAENITTAERIVNVINQSDKYAGNYNAIAVYSGESYSYIDSITTSNTINNRIIFSKFAFVDDADVYGDISDNTITIPSQNIQIGITPDIIEYNFSGTGTVSIADNTTSIVINFIKIADNIPVTGIVTYTK